MRWYHAFWMRLESWGLQDSIIKINAGYLNVSLMLLPIWPGANKACHIWARYCVAGEVLAEGQLTSVKKIRWRKRVKSWYLPMSPASPVLASCQDLHCGMQTSYRERQAGPDATLYSHRDCFPEGQTCFNWTSGHVTSDTVVEFLKKLLRYWPVSCGLSGIMPPCTGAKPLNSWLPTPDLLKRLSLKSCRHIYRS